jgi:hypothetical protein
MISDDDEIAYAEIDQMEWARPNFNRERINRAGRALVDAMYADTYEWNDPQWYDYSICLDVINNWRASHAYPLLIMRMTLGNYAKKVDSNPLVAQRIKRLVSIAAKLDREGRMKLSQMQDIGGCRAVVGSVSALFNLHRLYKESSIKHELASFDDYVNKPRSSGYRGLHLVYRYKSDKPAKMMYNDLKIEMQLRSQYQHAWATAVETVGTFIGQALKSSIGPERWLRFFQLMGTAIAIREDTPAVPGTPPDTPTLIDELQKQANDLNVAQTLMTFSNTMRILSRPTESGAYYYLLRLNAKTGDLNIIAFRKNESEAASAAYLDAEKEVKVTSGLDAVLVSVDSLSSLEKAYPNYFADTRIFVELMSQALSGHESTIDAPSLL